MKNRPTNPLEPLRDVQLSKDEQLEMLQNLRSIMEQEETSMSTLPSKRRRSAARHRKSKSVPVWVKTGIAGLAAVIVVGGVLFGIQHQLSSSATTAAHHKQPPSGSTQKPGVKTGQPPSGQQNSQSPTANQTTPTQVAAGYPLSHFHPAGFNAVTFVNSEVGFIGGQDGIYKTADGGKTWTKVYTSSDPILGLTSNTEQVQGATYIWVTAWTKSQVISSYHNGDKWSAAKTNVSNKGTIEDVSQLSDAQFLFITNGAIWASDASGSGWFKRTPPEPVASVANVGINTYYAATGSGAVYKTTDGGQTWAKVFTAPIAKSPHWQVQVQAIGNNVAVYYYGGDAAMSQQAYVMYESTDAGHTWHALFDEGYFPDYGSMKPLTNNQLSLQPGPFALQSTGDILYAGVDPQANTITTFSVISPFGQRTQSAPVGPAGQTTNVFGLMEMPTGIASADGKTILVVGVNNNKGVAQLSSDSGQTWHTPS